MKIRVLRIMHRVNVGGPTFHAGYLTKYLKDDVFETLLITGNVDPLEKSGEYILDDIGVKPKFIKNMYRSLHPFKDYQAYKEIKKIIKEYKPHIVHTHAAKAGALGRLAAINCDVPVIVHTFHGHVFHSYFGNLKTQFYLQIERYLAKRSSKIIAISNLQKQELAEDFKITSKENLVMIPLGFDLNRFQTDRDAKRTKFRKEFNIKNDEIAFGIVGRLAPIKNHALFIQGVRKILDQSSKKIRAFIVGDGEERERLEELANQLEIPFNTENDIEFDKPLCFTSWRQDIDVINAGLDIMTLTSLNEGTPVSLIEAQAANLPIVSTDVGGVKDIVLENESALIAKSCNLDDFAKKLLRCIEDDNLREQLSHKGYEYVMKNFSREKLVSNIRELYLSLLK